MSGVLDPSSMPAETAASILKSANATLSNTSGTSLLPSSPRELLSLPLRALSHAEKFAFSTAPRHIARMVGINDMTLNLWPTTAPVAGQPGAVQEAMAAASDIAAGVPEAVAAGDGWYVSEFMQTMRKVGGFFGYLTSIWSFACLVEVSELPGDSEVDFAKTCCRLLS